MKRKSKWIQLLQALVFQGLSIATIVSQIAVWLLSTRVSLFPGQETMQSIASSFAEIVAGLYGLTLASYTFFLSRIDGLAANNPTLEYVTGGLKRNFKYLIWHITFQVLMTLTIATILMYADAPAEDSGFSFWYRLFCNEFIVFTGFSVVLILYYSVLVINPKAIPNEARRLKKKLGGSGETGSLLEFLKAYLEIERCCTDLMPWELLEQFRQGQPVGFAVAQELLRQTYPEMEPILPELERVYRYYECVVNCSNISVSQEMCENAKALLEDLQHIAYVRAD